MKRVQRIDWRKKKKQIRRLKKMWKGFCRSLKKMKKNPNTAGG